MSFTAQSIADLAYPIGGIESDNLTGDNILGLVNAVLRAYYRDMGSQNIEVNLTTASTPPIVAGTAEYVVTTIDQIDEFVDVLYRLSSTSEWSVLQPIDYALASAYDQQSGRPERFYIYYPSGVQTLGFLPKFSSTYAVAGATLRLRVMAKPADLSLLSDSIPLPAEAKIALVYALAAEFATIDGRPADADLHRRRQMEELDKNAEALLKTELIPSFNVCPDVLATPGAGGSGTGKIWIQL